MNFIWLLVVVVMLAGMWKVFEKAGRQGWEAIVPIYNIYVLTIVVGQPWWLLILCLIPLVNVLVFIFLAFKLAERFGQGVPFTIGMVLLPFVFYPLLGFGDAQYTPPETAE